MRSEKILTETDLNSKGALVGASGDFSLSKLSALVNSRSRNRLVLAAYIHHCTEPAPEGYTARTPEQDQKHSDLALTRGRQVHANMQIKRRKYEGRESGGTDPSSADDGSSDEEGEEDEEELREIFPLPHGATGMELTGGLSMAGRRAVRKTVAFAVDIKHAEAMNAVFNAAGRCVYGRAAGGYSCRPVQQRCASQFACSAEWYAMFG